MKINLPQETIEQISKSNSEELASIIVVFRMLNTFKEEAKLAMIELMKRRAKGDVFDFEQFIEQELKQNNIDLKMPSFNKIKGQVIEKSIYNIMKGSLDLNDDDEEETEEAPENKTLSEIEVKKQKDLDDLVETIAEIISKP